MTIEASIKSASEPNSFVSSPIRGEWIIEGYPVARVELLSSSADGTASTYYWDCTAGRFNWYYSFDETLHIWEGSVTLKEPSRSSHFAGHHCQAISFCSLLLGGPSRGSFWASPSNRSLRDCCRQV